MDNVLELEREQLERAYVAAEARITRLDRQLKQGVAAVHNLAADTAAERIRRTLGALRGAISPDAGILLKGKVRFASHPLSRSRWHR